MTRLLLRLGMPRSRAIRLGTVLGTISAVVWIELGVTVLGICAGVLLSAMLPDRPMF